MMMNCFFLISFVVVTGCAQEKTEKCNRKIDLAVVLDVSGSINEKTFGLSKNFTKTLLRRFEISKDNVHVSLVTYSESVKIYSTFDDNQEEEEFERKVNNMFLEGASTATSKTLTILSDRLFVQDSGSRIKETDVKKVAVVVTDGFSFVGPGIVKLRADELKNRGVEVFAIGVTQRMGNDELINLSSKPVHKHFLRLTNKESIERITDTIVQGLCQ